MSSTSHVTPSAVHANCAAPSMAKSWASSVHVRIRHMRVDDVDVNVAGAGEVVLMTFNASELSMENIYSGCCVCSTMAPVKICERFTAEIYIHELSRGIMSKGYQAMFHCHHISMLCEVERIPHKLHRKTRKLSKVAPSFLRAKDRALVVFKLPQRVALETWDGCKPLSMFTLRGLQGNTVVIGKIRKIWGETELLSLPPFSKFNRSVQPFC